MGGRQETPILPVPVIREKSQFRAQHDSLSLSPWLMTAPAFIYTSEPWAALSFGRPIFDPNEGRSFAPVLLRFALHRPCHQLPLRMIEKARYCE